MVIDELNPILEQNSITKRYRCTEHPENTNMPSAGAGRHFTKTHGIRLDGTVYVEPPKDEQPSQKNNETDTQNGGEVQNPPSIVETPPTDKLLRALREELYLGIMYL